MSCCVRKFAVNFAVECGGGGCRSALEAVLEGSGHVSLIVSSS